MVGGVIIEVLRCSDGNLWINCRDTQHYKDECSVKCEPPTEEMGFPRFGDRIWWQGGYCYYTPKGHGAGVDNKLRKIGYSGLPSPKESNDV